MSRRTAEASKAVLEAWEHEQFLVQDGKGTREWSPEQQKDILDRGKAYDDNGKAFEGHHMKSAERYPEYQGDYQNIQFLSRAEHFAAHGGNFQNPANGYYNPITRITVDFGEGKYIACEIFELKNPIIERESKPIVVEKVMSEDVEKKEVIAEKRNKMSSDSAPKVNKAAKKTIKVNPSKNGKGAADFIKKTVEFYDRNKNIINPVLEGLALLGAYGLKKTSSSKKHVSTKAINKAPKINTAAIVDTVQKMERSSPVEHAVTGYIRHQNGKAIHVSSYTRGGKK